MLLVFHEMPHAKVLRGHGGTPHCNFTQGVRSRTSTNTVKSVLPSSSLLSDCANLEAARRLRANSPSLLLELLPSSVSSAGSWASQVQLTSPRAGTFVRSASVGALVRKHWRGNLDTAAHVSEPGHSNGVVLPCPWLSLVLSHSILSLAAPAYHAAPRNC